MIIVLFLTYLFCFGIPKMKAYIENKNIVTETFEEEPDNKAWTPAVTVCGAFGDAWKYEFSDVCKGISGDNLLQCFLNSTYRKEEVLEFVSPYGTKNESFALDITLREYGSCFTLKDKFRVGSQFYNDTFGVYLRQRYSWVFVHDAKFFYLSRKIRPVPSIEAQFESRNESRNESIVFSQEIELVKYKRRNTKASPCNEDDDYIVNLCLRNFMEQQVGCKIPWIEDNADQRLKKCSSLSEYVQILDHYNSLSALDEFKQVSRRTGCLAPCSYTHVRRYGDLILQDVANETMYILTLASTRIKVLTEHQYPDFASLIADIGGTLGLFLGFSFIMVWDSTIELISKIMNVFNRKNIFSR